MKFCDCGNLFDLFDDLEQRKLFYKCMKCDIKIPFGKKLIYSKNKLNIQKKWITFDKTLPLSNKSCFKCNSTVVYEKRNDLTLCYFCTNCNESWF